MDSFRHLPVQSLEDVTHNFEQLQSELGTTPGFGGSGVSRFLQLAETGAVKLTFGLLGPAGEVLYSGGGYTVTHAGTGLYKVKWATAKPTANYAVLTTPVNGTAFTSWVTLQEASQFQIGTLHSFSEFVDSEVAFLVLSST